MFAFIREPVPPARTRKPTLPKPVNSSSFDDSSFDAEKMDEGDFLVVDSRLEMDGAVNAYVDCNNSNS